MERFRDHNFPRSNLANFLLKSQLPIEEKYRAAKKMGISKLLEERIRGNKQRPLTPQERRNMEYDRVFGYFPFINELLPLIKENNVNEAYSWFKNFIEVNGVSVSFVEGGWEGYKKLMAVRAKKGETSTDYDPKIKRGIIYMPDDFYEDSDLGKLIALQHAFKSIFLKSKRMRNKEMIGELLRADIYLLDIVKRYCQLDEYDTELVSDLKNEYIQRVNRLQ